MFSMHYALSIYKQQAAVWLIQGFLDDRLLAIEGYGTLLPCCGMEVLTSSMEVPHALPSLAP